jgi:hypothetical protein
MQRPGVESGTPCTGSNGGAGTPAHAARRCMCALVESGHPEAAVAVRCVARGVVQTEAAVAVWELLARVSAQVGCGAGNSVYPLLELNPECRVWACDFSPRAVELVRNHEGYACGRVTAFVADITEVRGSAHTAHCGVAAGAWGACAQEGRHLEP